MERSATNGQTCGYMTGRISFEKYLFTKKLVQEFLASLVLLFILFSPKSIARTCCFGKCTLNSGSVGTFCAFWPDSIQERTAKWSQTTHFLWLSLHVCQGFVFIPLNGVFLCYTLSLHLCVKCSPFSVFKDRLLIFSQLAGLFATA